MTHSIFLTIHTIIISAIGYLITQNHDAWRSWAGNEKIFILLAVVHGFDDAATQTDFVLIKDHGLSGGDGALRLGETHFEMIFTDLFDVAVLVWLAITILSATVHWKTHRIWINPV